MNYPVRILHLHALGSRPFRVAAIYEYGVSADEELDNAMISLLFTLPRPFRPRFHALGSRPFRVAAIYEYGVCSTIVSLETNLS